MKVIIEGESKEIAALVVAIQERQSQQRLVMKYSMGDPHDLIQKYNEESYLAREPILGLDDCII